MSTESLDFLLTSESVTEGHPDKVCDLIADSVLDANIGPDPGARVACEVLCKGGRVVLAGEITSKAGLKKARYEEIVREVVEGVGYVDPSEPFHASGVKVLNFLTRQSKEIGGAVTKATDAKKKDQGAGDQGIMFGYATDETPELLPLPIVLAHRLTLGLAEARRAGDVPWLRPDGKSQVTVAYEGGRPVRVETVLISTQHRADVSREEIGAWVATKLAPKALDGWMRDGIRFVANPSGTFVLGGPSADAGVTGRKIIVDSYGGAARHGGGAWSGKDPSKVDRSGAYFCRWAARQVVKQGIARRAEIQVSYAIGEAKPMSVAVETFGTGDAKAAAALVSSFDFRPAAISERLNLRRPIYRSTTNYGHFGKPGLPWEE
ncbi:MAG TPA: methionine adenosyltransferase [Thermoanaerobaculia bacterium]|nr:methionine adenosyltransferase [Thermoanaerobaculia bacterium]